MEPDIVAEACTWQFAYIGDAITKTWRSFQRKRKLGGPTTGQGLIGAPRDDAELLEQALEHAMKITEARPWRLCSGG